MKGLGVVLILVAALLARRGWRDRDWLYVFHALLAMYVAVRCF